MSTEEKPLYECPSCFRVTEWTSGWSIAAGDDSDVFWCEICGTETPLAACRAVDLRGALQDCAQQVKSLESEIEDARERRRALLYIARLRGISTRDVGALAGMTGSAVSQALRRHGGDS